MFSAKKQVKTKKKVLKKGFCGVFLQLTTSAWRHQSTNPRKNLSWAILKPLAGHFWPASRGLDALVLEYCNQQQDQSPQKFAQHVAVNCSADALIEIDFWTFNPICTGPFLHPICTGGGGVIDVIELRFFAC